MQITGGEGIYTNYGMEEMKADIASCKKIALLLSNYLSEIKFHNSE